LRKYLPILVLALFILAGCATTMPTMPDVETQRAKDCVRECQRVYSLCVAPCQDTQGKSFDERSSRNNCIINCNQELDGCYPLCLEMDKGSFGCKLLIPGTPNPFTIGHSLFESN